LPSAVGFLVATGLQVSGWISLPVAFICWTVAALILLWAGWSYLKERRRESGVTPNGLIIIGGIGTAAFAIIGAAGLVWDHYSKRPPTAVIPEVPPQPSRAAQTQQNVPPPQSKPRSHLSESRPRIQDVIDWICSDQKGTAEKHHCVERAATEISDAARNGKITIWIHHRGSDVALTKIPIDIWQWATLYGVIGGHIGVEVFLKPQYRGLSRFPPTLTSQDAAMIAPYEDFDVMLVEDARKVEALWPHGGK
jgi:hypothetical protein